MSGKHQRTEKVNFLGMKYKSFVCTKCKDSFEDFGLNKGRKICPRCDNNVDILDEYKDPDGCNCYSCMAGRAMKKAINENNKET